MAQVGGRPFDYSGEEIARAMRNVPPEPIRAHAVDIAGRLFPPKQVVATLTGWQRTSFTTMEAQRVLAQQGFRSMRNANLVHSGPTVLEEYDARNDDEPVDDSQHVDESLRIDELQNSLRVAETAIAGLAHRVAALEAAHPR